MLSPQPFHQQCWGFYREGQDSTKMKQYKHTLCRDKRNNGPCVGTNNGQQQSLIESNKIFFTPVVKMLGTLLLTCMVNLFRTFLLSLNFITYFPAKFEPFRIHQAL